MKQLVTTTQKQPMKPIAPMQQTVTTAKDSASPMTMAMESATSSKSKGASTPKPVTTSIQASSQTL